MKVLSLSQCQQEDQIIEVEVTLTPGLPNIQFIGLPDAAIKESILKIRSAIYHQGFELPYSQQILVNLRPNYIKKSSQGLDLAVAAAILWETGQLPVPALAFPLLYGELTLKGEVQTPDDLDALNLCGEKQVVYTGFSSESSRVPLLQINELKELPYPTTKAASEFVTPPKRPDFLDFEFSEKQARWLSILALGEHSSLFVGPAGSGKSTLARCLSPLLKSPDKKSWLNSLARQKKLGKLETWRPFISPHHSTPPRSMIGGGPHTQPGEMSYAHEGILLLDELLEFPNSTLEALREPIETGHITINRFGSSKTFEADFQLLATANLCPCGHFLPKTPNSCKCRLTRLRSYLERLTGPVLDRFETLLFATMPTSNKYNGEKNKLISHKEIFSRVLSARKFIAETRGVSTLKKSLKEIGNDPAFENVIDLMPVSITSHRRQLSLLRVARTIADLDFSENIRPEHVQESMEMTWLSFKQLHEAV